MELTVMPIRIRFILFMRGTTRKRVPRSGFAGGGATGYPLAGVPVIAKET